MGMSRVLPARRPAGSWVALQVLLVAAGIVAYFLIRGLTEASAGIARRHAHQVAGLERALHLYVEPSVQAPLRSSSALEAAANWVYIWGHWPVLLATMAWLVWRHRPQFLLLRDAMLVSGALGLVVFISYPTAPPRLAGMGYVDTVTRSSRSYRYLQPPAFVDQYAAMPSLHVGWDLLAGLAVFTATSYRALRVAACVMPALMAWAVVATGNHFVLDVVAGVTLVLLGHLAALAIEGRRGRARASP